MQEIHLKELIGTAAFTQNGNYIVGTTDRQNAEFQAGCQKKLDIDVDALRARGDSVEIKGISEIEMTSENYNDILKVKGMPSNIFVDSFGYGMQKEISDCMKDYYAGNISEGEVKEFFAECCSSMRIYCAQKRLTSGKNETDNTQIVSQVYELFAKENQRAARGANSAEGLDINSSITNGERKYGWVYYNADYYYQCEAMRESLRQTAGEMAEKWELGDIDCEEIENSSDLTLDGGFDFNSGWNFIYRNQVGRSSMENEGVVPPEGFRFFYKENDREEGGLLKLWAGEGEKTLEVPFYVSRDSLKGQIFKATDLVTFTGKDTPQYQEYNRFLSNLSVFTRWYSLCSGINGQFGNYVPRYE